MPELCDARIIYIMQGCIFKTVAFRVIAIKIEAVIGQFDVVLVRNVALTCRDNLIAKFDALLQAK